MLSMKESESYIYYHTTCSEYEPMTREQEIETFKRMQAGDEKARDEIIQSNQRFVISMASKFFGSPLPLEDLIQEGNIGMIRAMEKFDLSVGIRFITYARWWVRQAMQGATLKSGYPVTLPHRSWSPCLDSLNKWSEIRERTGRDPTTKEISDALGISETYAIMATTMRRKAMRLDKEVFSEDERSAKTWVDTELMSVDEDQHDRLRDDDIKAALEDIMDHVTPRQAQALRIGLELAKNDDVLIKKEIANRLGVTRQTVDFIFSAARNRINRSHRMSKYKELLH